MHNMAFGKKGQMNKCKVELMISHFACQSIVSDAISTRQIGTEPERPWAGQRMLRTSQGVRNSEQIYTWKSDFLQDIEKY